MPSPPHPLTPSLPHPHPYLDPSPPHSPTRALLISPSSFALISALPLVLPPPQVGGQLVYPTLTDEWLQSDELQAAIDEALRRANQVGYASLSIALGGAS